MSPDGEPILPRGVPRRTALGLIAVGGLGACGLSVDPSVRPGLEVDVPQDRGIQYQPEGPRPGMTPKEIVLGFLRAGAATGSGLSVARSYLTDAASSAWRPDDAQTIVHADETPMVRNEAGTLHVQTRVVARIDPAGRFSLAKASDGAIVRFRVARVGGEWRIAEMQKDFGRLLPSSRVDQMYRRYRVHYAAIGWNRLVPDLRWIPSDQEATRLVRAQLGRVPDHLAGAVQTEPSAQLNVDAVPVVAGVAQVDLRPGLSADPTQRRNLAAQLVASLMQLPAVTQVTMSVDGSPIDLPGVEPPWTSASQLGFVPAQAPGEQSAVVRDGSRVVPVALSDVTSVTAADVRATKTPFAAVPKPWTQLAVSLDGKEVAGVRGSGLELIRWRDDGTSVAVPQFATDMAKPVYDASGVLWVAGEGPTDARRLWVVNTALDAQDVEAAPTPVPALWLSGRHPRSISVSPDSACIAVISTAKDGKDMQIQVSGVARQPNGLPTGTATRALRVAAVVEEAVDIAWITPTTVAVLGRRPGDRSVRPLVIEVGGRITALEPVPGARWISTTGGVRELLVVTRTGRAYSRTGGSWSRLPVGGVVLPSA